jgi:ferric-dicitrate binding protein FerR (iron transport regulator)
LNGNCTDEEFEKLLAWIREESMTTSGEKMVQEVWNEFESDLSGDKIKYDRLLDLIHHKININLNSNRPAIGKRPAGNSIWQAITRVAAILLLPVLSLLIYTLVSGRDRYIANSNELEVEAPAGFRMNIEFGDGTKVWLNHGSKLRYPYRFDPQCRKVFLTGEAYFVVAHNKIVPFVVSTKNLDIKATGTEFNVSAYPEESIVETTLVEGQVDLYEKGTSLRIETMEPGECIKYNSQTYNYTAESGDIKKYIAWKDGLLIFKNDSIPEIAKKLARWYNVDVKIENENVKEFTCTGTFSDETFSQVLELMSLPSPVSYRLTPKERLPDGSFSKQSVIIGLKKKNKNSVI